MSKRAAVGFDELTPRPDLLPVSSSFVLIPYVIVKMGELLGFKLVEFKRLTTIQKVDKMMGSNIESLVMKRGAGRNSQDKRALGGPGSKRELEPNLGSIMTTNLTPSNAGVNGSGSKGRKRESIIAAPNGNSNGNGVSKRLDSNKKEKEK